VPNPVRADLAGRDANRAAHSHPEHKPARPVLAGRTLPAPAPANALGASGDVPRDVRSGLRQGVGHQNLDRRPELAVFPNSDHGRPWSSRSVTSACAETWRPTARGAAR
jgi:hypothetical protein